MTRRNKILLIVALVIVVVVVALAVVVPRLVDLDRYRPDVIAYLETKTGKHVGIGRLELMLIPQVSIRADDVSLSNPPGFPAGDFLTAHRIFAIVDAGALWKHEVVIQSLVLGQPAIRLISNSRGEWNYQGRPQPSPLKKAALDQSSSFTLGVISRVEINGGEVTMANLEPTGAAGPAIFEAKNISSTLDDVDVRSLIGTASSGTQPERLAFAEAPLDAVISLGFAAYGDPPATPEAHTLATGDLKAASLRFGTLEVTSVKSKLRILAKRVYFDDLTFDAYSGRADGALWFDFGGANLSFNTKTQLGGIDVAKLLAAFPQSRGEMTGTMEGTLGLGGEVRHSPYPLEGIRGTGQLMVRNGRLPTLKLSQNLTELARIAGLGPGAGDPTAFSTVSADLNLADQHIASRKIVVIGNGMEATASGSFSAAGDGALDYQGVAQLNAQQNPLTSVIAGLSGATYAGGKLSFPFRVGGTIDHPSYSLNTANNLNPRGKGLEDLFKKKPR